MKTAYFDCMFGISGDMILGALVAGGMPLDVLTAELEKLGVGGFELKQEQVMRAGIAAVHVDVITGHQHEHRHLSHIRNIIESSTLSSGIKERAVSIFTRLAEAEAKVHDTTPEKIHFHEVGALDAIVDVVGACIGLDYFGVGTVVSTPLSFGTGTVTCAHGVMPVPVPAVVELTKGIPVVRTDRTGELTTPTGAAIITTLASSYGALDNFVAETAGYGAGTRESQAFPNVLRISIGSVTHSANEDHSVLIETNIDNMNPEIFGYLTEKLLAAGAKDVYMCSIFMKKGRPGTLLSILTDDSLKDTMVSMLFSETTTLGVRISRVMRKVLDRKAGTVQTEFGPVRVKTAYIGGSERCAPEYDDCARIARERNIPLMTVYDIIRKCTPS
ncbi:nickel pincer cofactor biosynthesis protein LarC [bacterium]|nr:nickel pincer cofactor biosynthesis protein LarC [bacterium]